MEHVAQTARMRIECKFLVETTEGRDPLMGVIIFGYFIAYLCVYMSQTIHWQNNMATKLKKKLYINTDV